MNLINLINLPKYIYSLHQVDIKLDSTVIVLILRKWEKKALSHFYVA